jgi:hypothetical protein
VYTFSCLTINITATSPSGKARVCKTLIVGSIPTVAFSKRQPIKLPFFCLYCQKGRSTREMKQPTLSPAQRLWPVMALLVFMFFLRAHHITVQEPFIDEGAHVARANAVRSFEQHPAREANGKLLLYLWLGLFELPPITALYVSRTAIALFSLINGAALYTLGRQIGSHTVGLLALGGYAVLPLAFFFERIALADPLAAALVSVLAWRSMIFARRPSLQEGGVVGVWVALAMLAKLTVGLIPLLPVAAAFVFYSWQSSDGWRPQLARWTGTYLPGLLVAAGVVTLFWLPVVIPALLAKLDGDPFVLVYGENLQPLESTAPLRELRSILPKISKYTTPEFLVISVLALGYLLWAGRSHPALLRNALFLAAWLMLITVLSLVASTGIRSRYLMPTAGPLVLSLAYAGVWAWQTTRLRGIVRGTIVLGAVIWLVTFALPFV